MGIFDSRGGGTRPSSGSGINDWGELNNDSVSFEDNSAEDFGLGSDFISIPSMPAELETFASSNSQDIDFNQDVLQHLSLQDGPARDEGFFPVTPDVPRRGNSSLGLGSREYPDPLSSSPHSRMSTGNLRSKYRPRDNILMAGNMELTTVTQQTTGAGAVGGFRSASVRPRDQLRFPRNMELQSTNTEYRLHSETRTGSCQPRNNLTLNGSVDYITNSNDFKGESSSKAKLEKPRHQLLTDGDLDLKSTTLETFKCNSGRRANIEKPRNHLMTTGDIDLKTTTSENFHFDGKFEKVEKVRRDNLKLTGERQLRTTHHDYKNFGEMASSELRAVPSWFLEPKSNPIIIS